MLRPPLTPSIHMHFPSSEVAFDLFHSCTFYFSTNFNPSIPHPPSKAKIFLTCIYNISLPNMEDIQPTSYTFRVLVQVCIQQYVKIVVLASTRSREFPSPTQDTGRLYLSCLILPILRRYIYVSVKSLKKRNQKGLRSLLLSQCNSDSRTDATKQTHIHSSAQCYYPTQITCTFVYVCAYTDIHILSKHTKL